MSSRNWCVISGDLRINYLGALPWSSRNWSSDARRAQSTSVSTRRREHRGRDTGRNCRRAHALRSGGTTRFRVFSTKRREARARRNLLTGDNVVVAEKHVPAFRTGKEVRELLNRRSNPARAARPANRPAPLGKRSRQPMTGDPRPAGIDPRARPLSRWERRSAAGTHGGLKSNATTSTCLKIVGFQPHARKEFS
jgi:hypothetical protein